MLSCKSMIILWEQERWVYPPILSECQNKRVGGWARPIWRFPLAHPYRKSTPSAHNKILCTDSSGKRQARQARRRRSPCRRSAMLSPCCCFWRSALTEQGAKTIAYTWRKNKAESKHNGKAKAKKTSKAGKRHTLKRDHEKASKKGNRQAQTQAKKPIGLLY